MIYVNTCHGNSCLQVIIDMWEDVMFQNSCLLLSTDKFWYTFIYLHLSAHIKVNIVILQFLDCDNEHICQIWGFSWHCEGEFKSAIEVRKRGGP